MTDDRAAPRLAPEIPLPPYSYVPGRGLPHPITDPAGHSFGRAREPARRLGPDDWPDNATYLYGFDLFNHQDFWEAHEAWEALWHAHDRRGDVADFVKALIKLAASGVKHLEGSSHGTRIHARRAADLWRSIAGATGEDPSSSDFLGLRLREIIDLADAIASAGWPEAPVILRPGPRPS